MAEFTALLISRCDIQEKTLSTEGYESEETWENKETDVPTRKDSVDSASISDTEYRENKDDDLFFFNSDVDIIRGNKIVFLGDDYDVIKVNKCFGATAVHHLEVVARLVDHE